MTCSASWSFKSVSKFFVVNKRLKNIYVAFTDFNPALRTAYVVS